MGQTILTEGGFTPLPGWPCAPASGVAPGIADKLTAPAAADLLPQVLALAPRGAAWGSDEYGDGQGASPNQLRFWTAIAGWSAASYARDADIAAQAFPSLVSWSLDDWEAEYGLPDPCVSDAQSTDQRLQALRGKFARVGAASPDYLICLAASLGYAIEIEEYNPLRCHDFRAGDRCFDLPWGDAFEVHAGTSTISVLRCDNFHAGDRLATWGNSALECAINEARQPQTLVFFSYDFDPDDAALGEFTLDDGSSGAGDALTGGDTDSDIFTLDDGTGHAGDALTGSGALGPDGAVSAAPSVPGASLAGDWGVLPDGVSAILDFGPVTLPPSEDFDLGTLP